MRVGVEVERVRHDGRFTVTVDGDDLVADQLLVVGGPVEQPRRRRTGDRRARPRGVRPSRSTTGPGRASGCGRSATSPAGRLHPRLPLPGVRRRRRPPRHRGRASRLPRGQPGDLHRPRDRLGRTDRGAGPRRRASGSGSPRRTIERPAEAGSTARARPGWSSSSPTSTATCWSGRRSWRRTAGRCSACWSPPSTPRCRCRCCAGCTSPTRPSTGPSRWRSGKLRRVVGLGVPQTQQLRLSESRRPPMSESPQHLTEDDQRPAAHAGPAERPPDGSLGRPASDRGRPRRPRLRRLPPRSGGPRPRSSRSSTRSPRCGGS